MIDQPRSFPSRGYLSTGLTVLLFVIGQQALNQRSTPSIEDLDKNARKRADRLKRTVLPPTEAGELEKRLVRAMEVEKLYLNADLRLSDLDELSYGDKKITVIEREMGLMRPHETTGSLPSATLSFQEEHMHHFSHKGQHSADGPSGKRVGFEVALKDKEQLAEGTCAFVFTKPHGFFFKAGQHVRERGRPTTISLFYSNRRAEDAPFLRDLEQLAKQNPSFKLIATMTGSTEWTSARQGERGYIDRLMLERYLDDLQSPIYYVAGLPGMVSATRALLKDSGVSEARIRAEEFGGFTGVAT